MSVTFLELGQGAPLLFLHGVGMCAAAYRPLLSLLARRYRVLAPDLPGAGGTPLPESDASLDAFAAEIQSWLDARGVRPAAVVGHSLGGGVALSMARARGFPERLVLVDSVGSGTGFSRTALVARFLFLKNLRVLVSPRRWPALWRVLPHFMGTVGLRLGRMLRLGSLALDAAQKRHEALTAPGPRPVFVAATDDELFPPRVYHDCAAGLPGSRVVEVPGGHDWCLLHPEEAARVILPLLSDAARAGDPLDARLR
jgi:pimeloyl-ACP methyl ester carboxylesterase